MCIFTLSVRQSAKLDLLILEWSFSLTQLKKLLTSCRNSCLEELANAGVATVPDANIVTAAAIAAIDNSSFEFIIVKVIILMNFLKLS
jgi:hypothetical protein